MLMIFLIYALYYAYNLLKMIRICCHGYDLITTPEGPTRIQDSANSKTATHWVLGAHSLGAP